MRLMPTSPHTRPMSFPATPEQLEQQAAELLADAERDIPRLKLGTMSRDAMWAAALTARAAGCVFVLPTSRRPAQLIPLAAWDEAVRLTKAASEMRAARAGTRAAETIRLLPSEAA